MKKLLQHFALYVMDMYVIFSNQVVLTTYKNLIHAAISTNIWKHGVCFLVVSNIFKMGGWRNCVNSHQMSNSVAIRNKRPTKCKYILIRGKFQQLIRWALNAYECVVMILTLAFYQHFLLFHSQPGSLPEDLALPSWGEEIHSMVPELSYFPNGTGWLHTEHRLSEY